VRQVGLSSTSLRKMHGNQNIKNHVLSWINIKSMTGSSIKHDEQGKCGVSLAMLSYSNMKYGESKLGDKTSPLCVNFMYMLRKAHKTSHLYC
jgi:hypothetical protein